MLSSVTFGTAAFATNTTIVAKYQGATFNARTDAASLVSTNSRIIRWDSNVSISGSASSTQIIENAAVNIMATGGNPTAGDGEVDIWLYYVIVDLP
jgi:hypothetical protein